MYSISTIESSLITAIKNVVTDHEVLPYQNDMDKFRSTHPIGTILVTLSEIIPADKKTIMQGDEIAFGVYLIHRNINTHTDCYAIMEKIRIALTSKHCWLVRQQFTDINGDEWHYQMLFKTKQVYGGN